MPAIIFSETTAFPANAWETFIRLPTVVRGVFCFLFACFPHRWSRSSRQLTPSAVNASRRMDALVFNWIGANREPARDPALGVSIKRSIVSDRESSQGRFNGPWSPEITGLHFESSEIHSSTNFGISYETRRIPAVELVYFMRNRASLRAILTMINDRYHRHVAFS